MRNDNKSIMVAMVAALLVVGSVTAQAGAKSADEQARASTREHLSTSATQAGQTYKVAKSCTYRGGPKSGIWDCR